LFGEIYDEMDFEREGMKEKRKRQRGNIRGNKTTN